MSGRLTSSDRTLGQPSKITVIFGRKLTKRYRGKVRTVIEDMDLPNRVIRSHYENGFLKQYVLDHVMLCTERASNNGKDMGARRLSRTLPSTGKHVLRKVGDADGNYRALCDHDVRRFTGRTSGASFGPFEVCSKFTGSAREGKCTLCGALSMVGSVCIISFDLASASFSLIVTS